MKRENKATAQKSRKVFAFIFMFVFLLSLAACGAGNNSTETEEETTAADNTVEEEVTAADNMVEEVQTVMKMQVQAGDSIFTATLEDNPAVDAFVNMLRESPVTLEMSDYSGFEKVGGLKTTLPASNSQITTHAGDIVLYNSNQIVIFYGSNSWSYTRLGRIDNLDGWEEALGSGDVTVTFSIK